MSATVSPVFYHFQETVRARRMYVSFFLALSSCSNPPAIRYSRQPRRTTNDIIASRQHARQIQIPKLLPDLLQSNPICDGRTIARPSRAPPRSQTSSSVDSYSAGRQPAAASHHALRHHPHFHIFVCSLATSGYLTDYYGIQQARLLIHIITN